MVRKGSRNMQKKAFVRRDMAIFNGIVLLLLIAAVNSNNTIPLNSALSRFIKTSFPIFAEPFLTISFFN